MIKPSSLLSLAAIALGSTLPLAAHAQSISPDSVVRTIGVGETITINKTITLGARGATNVDVFFLADNTGSMGGTINSAQAGAAAILNALPATYQFGVGRYFGDPIEGVPPATAYQQSTALTTSKPSVQAGINGWIAFGGGDTPEANFFALKQVADTATWRAAAQRLIVWFGDATSHTETTTKAQAIASLQAANAKVIAFNNGSAGSGIDGTYGADTNQASGIVAVPPAGAVGALINNFGGISNADFVTAVTDQITSATSSLDLIFGSTFLGGGLDISFACTDILGCDDVAGGESRTFDLTIKGLLPGIYNFNVFAQGIDAFETDMITVGTPAIPEPSTYALMIAGFAAMGALARRRKGLKQH